ncbi:MAG: periplasmic heavy metal sensor [Parvibaculum sp.]
MTDTGTSLSPAPEKPRRGLGPAFLASVALNLFLLGVLSVPLFIDPPRDFAMRVPGPGSGTGMFHSSFKDLPKEDRDAIRGTMLEHFSQIRPHLRAVQEARLGLADALEAEPYDASAVRAAFDAMDAAMRDVGAASRDAMMKGFTKLSPEQRRRVAEAMRERRPHVKTLWRDRRPGDGPEAMPGLPDDMPPPLIPPPD